MYSKSIQKLIDLFSKFPTVGPRTASRFVFYLLKLSKEEIDNLISVISELKNKIKVCKLCFNPFEPSAASGQGGELCQICSDPRRDKSLLCIVSNETDLSAIEKIKKYNGLYFILGGTVSTLKKADIEKLRVDKLKERAKNSEVKEIIIAINPTTEGEATALYLERLINDLNKKTRLDSPASRARRVTRLGRGLPVGGELEYADEETLSSALESRR